MRTPYTYRLTWTAANLHYYGARGARGCHPADLWKTYFTSSPYVAGVIERQGDPDIIKVTRTFETSVEAFSWEAKMLNRVDAGRNPSFINRSNGVFGPFMNLKGSFYDRKSAMKGVEGIIRKYGAAGSATQQTKDKVQATNRERYGTHHTLHLPEVAKAREEASMNKWGVTNPFYSAKFQSEQTNPLTDPIIRKKWEASMKKVDWQKRNEITKETTLKKYGTEYTFQSPVVKDKIKATMLKRYGVDCYVKTQQYRDGVESSKKPCPFGCRDGHKYDPGNLTKHLTRVHLWDTNQIKELRENDKQR